MPQELNIQVTVPDEFAAEVAATLRDAYPDVIAGTTSLNQAVQAVLAFWMANLLADRKAAQVRAAGQAAVDAAEVQRDAAAQVARTQAWETVRGLMQAGQLPSPAVAAEADETE